MQPSQAKQSKFFRRGEVICKAGDPITHVYLLRSGIAALHLARGEQKMDLGQVGTGQLLGEEALNGSQTWKATAVANNEVEVLAIAVPAALAAFGSGSPLVKAVARGLLAKAVALSQAVAAIKLENDPMPCAPERVTKLFATIYHTASYTGTRKENVTTVVWPAFKKYAQRVFLESPVRLEQAINILVKVGAARLQFIPCETDPDAPDELGYVHFTDLARVKAFFEYCRAGGRGGEGDDPNVAIWREIAAWNAKGKVELPGPEEEEGKDAA